MSCLLSASPPASVDTIQICAAALLHSGNRAIQQIAADLVTIGLVHGRAGLLECSHVHIVDDGAAAIFHLGEHIAAAVYSQVRCSAPASLAAVRKISCSSGDRLSQKDLEQDREMAL